MITYQANHLKTEQVFTRLVEKYPCESFTFYGLPFVQRPKREVMFEHRPDQSRGLNTLELAAKFNCKYLRCSSDADIPSGDDIYLILGAGILSADCIRGKRILNAHPGVIPTSRGLDAFKWAIYDGDPIGNSLHFIDAAVDAGEIVSIRATPVYRSDTLEAFAARHYAREIEMLADFEHYLNARSNDFPDAPIGEPHRRMKPELERELRARFEVYKTKFAS